MDNENQRYDESFRPSESNNGEIKESYRFSENDHPQYQPESEKSGENISTNQVLDKQVGKAKDPSAVAKVLARIATGATSLAIFVLVFVIVAVNDVPKADLVDFYAGANYIEFNIEASKIGDYDMYIKLSNDFGTYYEEILSEGENRAMIEELQAQTQYRLTVSGKSKFGTTTILSKTIKTAGDSPAAEVRNLSWKENEQGKVDVSFDLRFSDPSGLIESAEMVWVLNDGEDSGGGEMEPHNEDFRLSSFDGIGKFDVFLYCTINGDRLLYSMQTTDISPVPQQYMSMYGEEPKTLFIDYSIVDFGFPIEYFEIDFDDYYIRDITVRNPESRSFQYEIGDCGDKVDLTVTLGYMKAGRVQTTEKRMSFAFEKRQEIIASLWDIHDEGDRVSFNLFVEGSPDDNYDLVLSSKSGTVRIQNIQFEWVEEHDGMTIGETVVEAKGLVPRTTYSVELKISSKKNGNSSVNLGTITTCRDVSFEFDFIDRENLAFRLIYDDEYGYYDNFRAVISNGEVEYEMVKEPYDSVFRIPEEYDWTGTDGEDWTITVTADSAKPYESGTQVVVATLTIR